MHCFFPSIYFYFCIFFILFFFFFLFFIYFHVLNSPVLAFHLESIEGVDYIVTDDQFLDFLVEQLTISDDMVKHYPMLVPPRPWQTPIEGGYGALLVIVCVEVETEMNR